MSIKIQYHTFWAGMMGFFPTNHKKFVTLQLAHVIFVDPLLETDFMGVHERHRHQIVQQPIGPENVGDILAPV